MQTYIYIYIFWNFRDSTILRQCVWLTLVASKFPSHYASTISLGASRTVKFNQHHQHYHYAAMGCKKSQENFVDSKLINKTLSETAARSRQNLFTFRLRAFATWQRHYTIYMHVLPAIREMKCPDLQQANWEAGSTQQAVRSSSRWWWARRCLIKENVITFAPDSWQFCITKATRAARILRLLMRQAPQKAKLRRWHLCHDVDWCGTRARKGESKLIDRYLIYAITWLYIS